MGLSIINETEERNREAFKERYGIDIPVFTEEELSCFAVAEAKSGDKILWVNKGGISVRMNSAYDPVHEAESWAKPYITADNVATTIAINGLLNGYFLRALKKALRPNVRYVVYEPFEDLFSFVCRYFELSDIFTDERITLVLPSMDKNTFFNLLQNSALSQRNALFFRLITPGYKPDDDFYDICSQVRDNQLANDNFRNYIGQSAFKSRLHALSVLNTNYLACDLLERIPAEIPVILVAGGPSLLKNIDELKKAKGRALIVAVERVVGLLLKNGIVPDIAVTIDIGKQAEYLSFDEMKDVCLLCGFEANYQIMLEHEGHLVFIHPDGRFGQIPGLKGRLLVFGDVGGGVTPAAFVHFLYNKVNNLILAGLDLAIEGPRTHAYGENDRINENEMYEVEGINGGIVRSRVDFIRVIKYMEQKISEYPDTVVTDATEGGALIHGTRVSTLKDAIDELCTKEWDIAGIISSMPNAQTAVQHEETLNFMCERIYELKQIKELSSELSLICRQLFNICIYGNIADKKNFRKIDRMTELKAKLQEFKVYWWLEDGWMPGSYPVPEHLIVVRNNDEAAPVFRDHMKYFSALPEYCDSLKRLVMEEFKLTEEEYKRRIGSVTNE